MILVTGGTGFLGSHLIKALAQKNIPVRALRRKNSDTSHLADLNSQIEWIECDLRDPVGIEDTMQGVKQVYHCAATVSFNSRLRREMFSVNVEGTANVVNCALNAGIEKLVHVSSIASLGRVRGGATISENTRWTDSKLNSNYSKSKFNSEREVWRGLAEGLNVVIVNPSVILGPWKWNEGTARFFSRMWSGQSFYTDGVNGFVDVRDVVEIMMRLMDSSVSGERYIVSAENLSYRDLLTKIAHALNKKAPVRKAGKFLLNAAVFAETTRAFIANREPLINPETARFGQQKFFYDNSKIVDALNYRFRTMDKTIQDIAQLFLESIKSKSLSATFY